jgi:hypothetical protein
VIALTSIGLVVGYWGLFGWMVYSSPLSYVQVDINHDGKVEFSKADYASSVGERPIENAGLK